ncbi:MAG: hypothetical protein C4318_05340 [Acidimicrobiia bacterium]
MSKVAAGAIVGVVAGILSGAAGLGGAIVSTPGIRVLGAAPLIAVGTTVPAIVVASASGSWNYLRSRCCDLPVAFATGATGVIFTVLGALFARVVGGRPLMLATACLVVYGGGRIFQGRHLDESSRWRAISKARVPIAAGIGVVAGFLSGALGIGGGIVMLPAYYRLLGMPIKKTTGTSLVVAGLMAIPGTLVHWRLGNIDWYLATGLCAGALVGSYLGSRVTLLSGERRVRIYVGVLLVAIGTAYGVGEAIAWIRA